MSRGFFCNEFQPLCSKTSSAPRGWLLLGPGGLQNGTNDYFVPVLQGWYVEVRVFTLALKVIQAVLLLSVCMVFVNGNVVYCFSLGKIILISQQCYFKYFC